MLKITSFTEILKNNTTIHNFELRFHKIVYNVNYFDKNIRN